MQQSYIKSLLNPYIRIAFFVALFLIPAVAFSQDKKTGSVEYLKLSNGFKDIKLGSDIRDLPQRQLTFMDGDNVPDADSCVSYVFYQNKEILKVDSDMNLQQVGLRVYHNKIVNIYLFFALKDSYKILRDFLKDYGQFTDLPKEYANIYMWNTHKVGLSLEYQADVETGVAIFTCNDLVQDIEAMKERKKFIESIASLPEDKNEIKAVR